MKFIKLEILNLASLDRQGGEEINFEKGALGESHIFSIVGPTGSGKSTLLDAICLALYNRAPRYPRKKGDRNQGIEIYGEPEDGEKNRLAPTDPRNILTRGKKEGYSKLTFLANNGIIYRAEWHVRFQRVKYDNAITRLFRIGYKDGVPVEEEDDWDMLPQGIIGLDYEQFLRTVLIAQGSFANFLTAKENERYELLEKLIGGEELYTGIAEKIRLKREEASEAYELIAATYAALGKDFLGEEELAALRERIAQLEEQEQREKAELEQVRVALAWYATENELTQQLKRYEEDYAVAQQRLDAVKDATERLALHDATLPAATLFRAFVLARENVRQHTLMLERLDLSAAEQTSKINEAEQRLQVLQENAQKAAEELERLKPAIIEARAIKVELNLAQKFLEEKAREKAKAERAAEKAREDVDNNRKAIACADEKHGRAVKAKADIIDRLELEGQRLKAEEETTSAAFLKLHQLQAGYDNMALHEEKTLADQSLADLKDALRLLGERKEKHRLHHEYTNRLQALDERNGGIEKALKAIDTDAAEQELQTLREAYTLMTSEDWEHHRLLLSNGQPCPLCGATDHPYRNGERIKAATGRLKTLVDEKTQQFRLLKNRQQQLTKEHSENLGLLRALKQNLMVLDDEMAKLDARWTDIHSRHPEWQEDAEMLRNLQDMMEAACCRAAKRLEEHSALLKQLEICRKKKETAQSAIRQHERTAAEKIQKAEERVSQAFALLSTEQGKTKNLQAQQEEKTALCSQAFGIWKKAEEEVEAQRLALHRKLDGKDPDAFETALEEVKAKADKALKEKGESIARMREKQKELQGTRTATERQREAESKRMAENEEALDSWLSAYNKGQSLHLLTFDDIAALSTASDNWEDIRAQERHLRNALTTTHTTLHNARLRHQDHQAKRPEQTEALLSARKTELEAVTHTELVDAKAMLQRHERARQQMGGMAKEKEDAEMLRNEWGEIADAIGTDGKTLRKMAQCYTLRFLVEHANVEIRKFNSRYELLQVRHSLGIRVIDHDRADDIRDTTSLSGGETFIVSLGLALGLSSLSSRSISFENLFIDEGFGTLDPDALATVIDALALLQHSQGKKVGVISHTDTMSERITTQIRIVKNGNSGSSHIEMYP